MNRRQPRNRQLRNIMIIKAHNRLIARHTYPALMQPGHDARRQNIRRGENPRDFGTRAELMPQLLALLHGNFLRKDKRRVVRHAVFRQGAAIALQAQFNNARGGNRRRRERNHAVAVLQQVLRGEVAAFFILQADAADVRVVHIAVDEDDGNAQLCYGIEERILKQPRHNQPGEPPAVNQPLQRGDAFGGAQHQVVAGFAGALLDAGGDAAHEGVADGAAGGARRDVSDHGDDGGLVVRQRARGHAGNVVFALDNLPDFCNLLFGNAAFAVMHHVGNGCNAYACFGGNVFECDHAMLHFMQCFRRGNLRGSKRTDEVREVRAHHKKYTSL